MRKKKRFGYVLEDYVTMKRVFIKYSTTTTPYVGPPTLGHNKRGLNYCRTKVLSFPTLSKLTNQ